MIRAARLAAAMLLACLGLVLLVEAPAFACTCKQAGLEQQAKQADAIFIGTIDSVATEGNDHTYSITASRAYLGTPERLTQVESLGSTASCGLGNLDAGTTYVFFANGTSSPYDADGCPGGTSTANPTRITKIEEILGEGTSVDPPPPPEATLDRVEESAPPGFARMAAPGGAAAIIGLLGLVVVRRLARR